MDQVILPTLPTYMFEPSLQGLLSFILTLGLPIVVGLLTRPSTHAGLKAVGLLFLAAVKSVVEALILNPELDLVRLIYTTALNFAVALLIHYGIYRPTGVTDAAQRSLVR